MSFNKIKDQKLIERLKRNDEDALKLIYNLYWEQLFIYAFSLLKKREISEDVIQEIFIKIWEKRDALLIKTTLKGYLYTCVLHKVYDIFRKDKNAFSEELLENFDVKIQTTTPESKLIYKELEAQINTVVNTLPEKCKKVFKLSRENQLSHKEISSQLNISTKSVEAYITKALKIIRPSLVNIPYTIIFLFFL
ncbi:RNA polymerase sigma-70 factor [Hwangdonia seohaensis]|uniref:RNA polymerase sigma-70 factor n=1 Tax=Hwangdonia seohaensis TaxID=1240727 RepID=A0ABW3RC25_9FLAO|nr:RNA polymerase sigma-70 factor [Hwangdonia seohaensis]